MIKQRSDEWFKQRGNRVTGSIAGALLGLSPFMTKKQAVDAITGNSAGETTIDNHILEYGKNVEETAIGIFELVTGYIVQEAPFIPYREWAGASPDGYVIGDDGNTLGVVEIKCPWSKRKALSVDEFKSIKDQPHYYAQVQMEMLSAKVDKCWFFQYGNGYHKLEVVDIDKKWLDENIPILFDIWKQAMKDQEDHVLVDRYLDLTDQINRLEDERKTLMELIKKETNGVPGYYGSGFLQTSNRQGSVSYAKVVKDHLPDVDLEPYRGKPSIVWSIKRK